MTRPHIVVTRKLPDAVEARLLDRFSVTLNTSDDLLSHDDLCHAMGNADGVLCTITDGMNADVLGIADRQAGIVANFGVGVNNIDLDAAKAAGIVVTNTPDVLTDASADLAIALILASTRHMRAAEERLRRGDWTRFDIVGDLGMGLRDKTLGIIGMGRIGQATARRAHLAFGMNILYFNRSEVTGLDFPAQAAPDIETVMARSDVISLHIPGGGASTGLISADRIALMRRHAYLVNTARGDVVDEAALTEALANNRIAGAGLDVFAREPQVPEGLLALDNVTLLPHIGSATIETRTAMGMCAVDNLIAHFEGKTAPNRVA